MFPGDNIQIVILFYDCCNNQHRSWEYQKKISKGAFILVKQTTDSDYMVENNGYWRVSTIGIGNDNSSNH